MCNYVEAKALVLLPMATEGETARAGCLLPPVDILIPAFVYKAKNSKKTKQTNKKERACSGKRGKKETARRQNGRRLTIDKKKRRKKTHPQRRKGKKKAKKSKKEKSTMFLTIISVLPVRLCPASRPQLVHNRGSLAYTAPTFL